MPGPGPQSFADPGQDFQATDVIDERNLPWRRLLFGGRSPSITFIHYEKGGRALSRHVFVGCSDAGARHLYSYLAPLEARDAASLFEQFRDDCLVTPPREHLEETEIDRCARHGRVGSTGNPRGDRADP